MVGLLILKHLQGITGDEMLSALRRDVPSEAAYNFKRMMRKWKSSFPPKADQPLVDMLFLLLLYFTNYFFF